MHINIITEDGDTIRLTEDKTMEYVHEGTRHRHWTSPLTGTVVEVQEPVGGS